jgi:hypothetical protein
MKSILSLILPSNPLLEASKRYLKAGRKGIGFQDNQLITFDSDGRDQGYGCLTEDDIQENITTNLSAVTKRFVIFSGNTGAIAADIPAPSGELRELIIQNANTSSGAVTVSSSASNIFGSASATVSATSVIAIDTTARFLSNGTYWYRVS